MTPKLDPAILEALSLDASTTNIANHGSSGFASTFKITSTVDGKEKLFFMKTGQGSESEIMFAGEHASLNAIHNAVPSLCPASYAHGRLSSGSGSYLVTDFLNLSPSSTTSKLGSNHSLAQKLAKLHSTPAPVPPGESRPVFGFPVPTCCGNTEQDNSFKHSWAGFYAENRLRGVLRKGEQRHGKDKELTTLVEKMAGVVVPRLLREGHLKGPDGSDVQPVVVHGDLWSGNHGMGTIGDGGVEEVVFGIMRMFGGFGASFEKEYHKIKPKDEPVDEYEDRIMLYELYHHLNHYSMFGGWYRGGAVRIMETLARKYGGSATL